MTLIRRCFLSLILLPLTALAEPAAQSLIPTQKLIEDRVAQVLRVQDPKALVFVTLKVKTREQALPMTPFAARQLPVLDEAGNERLESVNVLIYGSAPALSEETQALIRKVIPSFGVTPRLTYEVLPTPPPVIPEAPMPEVPDTSLTGSPARDLQLFGGILVLIGLILSFGGLARAGSFLKVLENGFNRLVNALESGSTGSRAASASAVRRDTPTPVETPAALAATGSTLTDFGTDSLVALLSDCYWANADGEAAWIWSRLGLPQKRALLENFAPTRDYVAHFQSLSESSAAHLVNDPYYLTPLPLAHLANDSVARLVVANPGFYRMLPALRREPLPLRALDRLRLEHVPNGGPLLTAERLLRETPSPGRALRRHVRILPNSVEEELEVLQAEPFHVQTALQVVSLGWLLKLPRETAAAILQDFSARDLMSAWVAPEPVLRALEELVPEKKRQLMRSYETRVHPSRSTPAFREIHRRVQQAFTQSSEQKGAHVDPAKNAA